MSGNKTVHEPEDHFNDFQDFPEHEPVHQTEPGAAAGHPEHQGHPEEDAYGDISEHSEHHDDVVDEQEAEEEHSEDEPARRSLISKSIIPAGAVVLTLAAAGLAWQLGAFDGSSGSQQTFDTPQSIQPIPMPSRPPAAPSTSSQGPVTLAAPSPSLPTQFTPKPAVMQSLAAPALPMTALPTQQQVMMPSVSTPDVVRASQPVGGDMPDVARSIDRLVGEMQVSNKTAEASNGLAIEIRSMRDTMIGKLDNLGIQMSTMVTRVDSVDNKVKSLESRLATLEARNSSVPMPPTSRASAPVTSLPMSTPTLIQRHSTTRHSSTTRSPAPVSSSESIPDKKITQGSDYRLVGASRDSALVQTSTGMVQVQIGKPLPNGSVARGFRQEGADWVLMTSGGDVRP